MKDYKSLRQETLDKINRTRRTLRIITQPEFKLAWETLTPKQASRLEACIALNQYEYLEDWLNSQIEKTLDDLTLKELRVLAKKHRVRYYGPMSKAALILEISNAIDLSNQGRNAQTFSVGQNRS